MPRSSRSTSARRVTRLLLLALVTTAPTGCLALGAGAIGGGVLGGATGQTADARASLSAPGAGAAVTVTFPQPADIPLVGAIAVRDTSWLRATTSITGRVLEARGDTLVLEVADVSTPSGRANLRRGTRATLVPQASNPMTVRLLSNNPRRTNGAAAGIALGTVITFTGILWYCVIEGCGG